jgi:ATP-dependent Clp protease adaptor protein ClpS
MAMVRLRGLVAFPLFDIPLFDVRLLFDATLFDAVRLDTPFPFSTPAETTLFKTALSGIPLSITALLDARPFLTRTQPARISRRVFSYPALRRRHLAAAAYDSSTAVKRGWTSRTGRDGHACQSLEHAPETAAGQVHWRRYHALPLEHAYWIIIFHYKIAPVCGILIRNKKTTSCPESMTLSVCPILSAEPRTSGRPHAADDDRNKRNDPGGPGTAVITKTKTQVKKPSFYRVLLLNDDYTPMEFVVHVLERFFNKDREAATRIMLHVHHHGIGECGVYTYEVAETKVTQVMDFARKHQHPLQCVMEKK